MAKERCPPGAGQVSGPYEIEQIKKDATCPVCHAYPVHGGCADPQCPQGWPRAVEKGVRVVPLADAERLREALDRLWTLLVNDDNCVVDGENPPCSICQPVFDEVRAALSPEQAEKKG